MACLCTGFYVDLNSGAEMNLKVGEGHRSGAKVGRGAPIPIYWSCPSTFSALKVQLVILVSAFVMVSTVWSVACLLFLYSRCYLRAQTFVKVGVRAPVPYGVGATGLWTGNKACSDAGIFCLCGFSCINIHSSRVHPA